jgi:hypothetical protein
MDRTDCSARPSHHHRPDRPGRRHCDDGTSHRPARHDNDRRITVHVATGHGENDRRTSGRLHDRPARTSSTGREQAEETISSRSAQPARSDSRRRSEVTERPQNVRPARHADRTHNSHRYQPSAADRPEGGTQTTTTRAYRGSHRAEFMHRPDDRTGSHHRSSRMGRHHAEQQDNQDHQQNRW